MAAWVDSLARRFGYAKPAPAPQRRDFSAAVVSRLTASWRASNLSANADLYRSLDVLRARSRDLCNNNTYARKFLSMVGVNVVGANGFALQARIYDRPGVQDKAACDAVEAAWSRWCARGVCDAAGQHSFRDLCTLLIRATARDGEFIVRILRGKSAGNAFGFALQALDIDRLDTSFNRSGDGNDVRMGVEISDTGRPVAYYLKTEHPGDMWLVSQSSRSDRRLRVPAADILHRFIADRPEQQRGVPWMHASMTQLNNLGGYEEAAIIAARVGASKMGFFTSPDGNLDPLADGQDEAGVPYTDADPGTFGTLPAGYDFKSFNPDYPHAMFGEFIKAALRGAASGMDVAYHSLGNDLEGVNFSSIRAGTLEERDLWMQKQAWFIDSFLEPVYAEWLRSALAFGQIALPNGTALPVEKADKFMAHEFQPRRWPWVDPLKDIEAARLEVKSGIASPQMIAARNGVDIEDVLDGIAQFEEAVTRRKLASVTYAEGVNAVATADAPGADPADVPAVKAAQITADAQVRSAELAVDAARATQPAQTIIHLPASPEVRNDITVQAAAPVVVPAPEVRNEITVAAPAVHVAAPNVEVRAELVLPEQPAPIVEVKVDMPDTLRIASLPERITRTEVARDISGNLVTSTQREVDA